MRQGLLWLSERQGIFNFVRRNGLARKFASRFVAGETIEAAWRRPCDLAARASPPSSTCWARACTPRAGSRRRAGPVSRRCSIGWPRREGRGQRFGQAHPDGPRYRRGAVRRQHGPHPRQGAGSSTDSSGSTWRDRTTPSAPSTSSAIASSSRIGPHCGVVIQSMLRALGADIEDLIALQRAGPAVQGRLPGAALGRVSGQDGRGPQLCRADGAAAAAGQLPGHRHPRRGDHRPRPPVRPARAHRVRPLRVPDALRRAARPPEPAPSCRAQHAGLYPLRDPVVSLSHAAAGGAPRQHRVHSRKPRSRVGAPRR